MITSSFPVTSGLKLTGSDFHGVFRAQNFSLINLPQKVFEYLQPFSLENYEKSSPVRKNGPKTIYSLDLKGKPGTDLPLTDVPYQYWDSNVNFWKYLIIIGAIVFFIMLLITIGLRKRIKGIVSIIFASLKKTFFGSK